jgi:hypothetical protein
MCVCYAHSICSDELKRAIHYVTCLDTSVSSNMSQRVWRCLKAGCSITALTVYHDTLQLRLM